MISLENEQKEKKYIFAASEKWHVEYTDPSDLYEIVGAINEEINEEAQRLLGVNKYSLIVEKRDKNNSAYNGIAFTGTEKQCLEAYHKRRLLIIDCNGEVVYYWSKRHCRWIPAYGSIATKGDERMATKDELLAQAEKEAAAAAKAMEEMDKHKREMERLLKEADAAEKSDKK